MNLLIILSTLVLATVIAVAIYFFQSGQVPNPLVSAQPTLLLVGPQNSGKTCLFRHVVHGSKHAPTYTSQRPNIGQLVLDTGKQIRIVDVPGHPKLFGAYRSYAPTSICFTIDASTIKKNADSVARSLVEILTYARQHNVQEICIFANKSDFFTALSTEQISELLDTEIEQIRMQTDGVQMDSIEEKVLDEDDGWLQDISGPFKITNECAILSGSVLKDDVAQWKEWASSAFSS